ncbi:MAG: PhoU domain-containing protein [Nitrososphaerota archaeon]|nr:PhoU domain-containing protein [Nitrososphaerota archaeon]
MGEYIRRVQLTGGTTLTVSLPKDWAAELGLKPGSLMRLIPRRSSGLLLIPEGLEENRREARLVVRDDTKAEMLLRDLISLYLAGYDIIKIEFLTPHPLLKLHLKDNMRRKLMGVEILKESVTEMLLQCFAQHVELPLNEALSRQAELAASMQRDATTSLITGDRELAEEVIQRDDEVDKLFYFIGRQLNLAAELPKVLQEFRMENAMACLSYAMVTKAIERIGDHASNIASASLSIEGGIEEQLATEIRNLDERVKNIFLESIAVLLRKDGRAANSIIEKVEDVRKLYAENLEKVTTPKISPKKSSLLRMALGDWMRIAEYSADISEQAIFLSLL